jgi:hypothetical protein
VLGAEAGAIVFGPGGLTGYVAGPSIARGLEVVRQQLEILFPLTARKMARCRAGQSSDGQKRQSQSAQPPSAPSLVFDAMRPNRKRQPTQTGRIWPMLRHGCLALPADANAIALPSNEKKSREIASPRTTSQQLTVSAVRPLLADEVATLMVSANDADPKAAVEISGLAAGSALSAGMQVGPNTWQLSAEGLDRAVITPPRSFVGAMDLTLELHLAEGAVADRKSLRILRYGWTALQDRSFSSLQAKSCFRSGLCRSASTDPAMTRTSAWSSPLK